MDFKKSIKKFAHGFTIVELLVTIAIIALIMSVVIMNRSDFTDEFNLSSNASDLELQIRQAQIYGVSVKEFTPSSNEFNDSYGVSVNALSPSYENFYISFADRGTKNGTYDSGVNCPAGGTSECTGKFYLTGGITISQVCAIMGNSNAECSPQVGRADITFNRPDPSANFVFYNSQGNQTTIGAIGVRIDLISPQGRAKSIYVYSTGQIAVLP